MHKDDSKLPIGYGKHARRSGKQWINRAVRRNIRSDLNKGQYRGEEILPEPPGIEGPMVFSWVEDHWDEDDWWKNDGWEEYDVENHKKVQSFLG